MEHDLARSGQRVSTIRVACLGPPGVGTSSLIRRFCVDQFGEDQAAARAGWGARFHSKLLLAGGEQPHVLRFQVWDVPGGDELLAPVYMAQAHVCIICFDLSRPASLSASLRLLQGVSGQDRPNSISALVLAGCKADAASDSLAGVLNEAAAAALQHNCAFVAATSSKDGAQGSSIQGLFVRAANVRDQARETKGRRFRRLISSSR